VKTQQPIGVVGPVIISICRSTGTSHTRCTGYDVRLYLCNINIFAGLWLQDCYRSTQLRRQWTTDMD